MVKLISVLFLFSCGVLLLSPQAPPPAFEDIARSSGIGFKHAASKTSRKYLPESMSGGVAMFDYNGDGRLDLFFVNGAALADPMPAGARPDKSDPRYWNRLYRNKGDGTFKDVTEEAGVQGRGYGMGAATGDFNNDGHTDLYVTNLGENLLYRNNGDGTFNEVSSQAGTVGNGWSAGAAFVDFDRDGHLDLAVSRYVVWDFSMDIWCGARKPGHRSYCHPDQFEAITHVLYRNKGDGTFTDVSESSQFGKHPGKGLGIAIDDFDRDGWPDIFAANDSFPQQLFRSRRDGTFEEIGLVSGLAYDDDGRTFAGMGIAVSDYDNDGWPDVFVNALANQKYALFRNIKGNFEYVSGPSGIGSISALHSGWGTRFLDSNNDGWKDLFVGQGHVMDNVELTQPNIRYLEPLLLMSNEAGKFRDVTRASGPAFEVPVAARGVAVGDLNNDGALDIVVNCNDGSPMVLMNRQRGNHWLMLALKMKSGRDAIGARVRSVMPDGTEQHAFLSTAASYLSANDPRVHFGLGKHTQVRSLEIIWPSGARQRLETVAGDQLRTLVEPDKPQK